MKVLKFGGSSLGSLSGINNVRKIIVNNKAEDFPLIIIVSALQGITDELIDISSLAKNCDSNYLARLQTVKTAHCDLLLSALHTTDKTEEVLLVLEQYFQELQQILHGVFLIRELSPRTLDLILSFGERASGQIVTAILSEDIERALYVDARELLITDSQFGAAKVNFILTADKIKRFIDRETSGSTAQTIFVTTGFIASSEQGETTTLGRGGSDYSASIFGAVLNVSEIEIWTDVDGVMTSDPRKTKKAFPLTQISYKEAMELSHFGARVIYPPTMQPAFDATIPIRVLNTFNPNFTGTLIGSKSSHLSSPVAGISSIPSISLIRVEGSGMIGVAGISSRIFTALARNSISVILISQASSEHSICFAVRPKESLQAKHALESELELELRAHLIDKIIIESELAIIAIVGENMRRAPGISGRLFQALGKNGINVVAIAQGSSELNISVVVPSIDESKALNALHDAFFLSDLKSIHLFLLGIGQIGQTLLEQLRKEAPNLTRTRKIEFKLVGLGNSRQMFFDSDGISLENWRELLKQKGKTASLGEFFQTVINLNLPNSLFIDCTASDKVAAIYEKILRSAISVITPNKKANSGPVANYLKLKEAARRANSSFFYETNVGAGLPVIGTLNDLICSGDDILRIEAVLSGTLSFIFNNLSDTVSFSEIVTKAKQRGFTEPDPREDLSGRDVARKLLILAREAGFLLEEQDIEVENLVPEQFRSLTKVEEFMAALPQMNEIYEQRRKNAAENDAVLRYIAQFDGNKAQVILREVDSSHPFFTLSGTDNIISFTTNRYLERPLIVKGPGAGREVTAAGVFADIVRASSYLS